MNRRKASNQRKDFLHKLSKTLIDKYDVIVFEDINLQTMSKSKNLGKSVGDMGFGMFRSFVDYKSKLYNSYMYKVDKFFPSSQLCSECGFKNAELKDVSIREWTCPICGAHHDRDINAGINLKQDFEATFKEKLYLYKEQNTAGIAGIHACGDNSSTLSEMIEQVLSTKQEALCFS